MGAGAEKFPPRVKAQIRMKINATGKPITSNIAINPKPSMKTLPNIMASFSFQPFFDELNSMPDNPWP